MAVPISFRKEANQVGHGCLDKMFATASMGMVFRDSQGEYHPWVGKNNACHANLNHHSHPEYTSRVTPVCAVTVLPQGGWKDGGVSGPREPEYEFVKWLIKESPWKDVWYTRQVKQALKQGYIVARTKVPQNVLSSALIATRALQEHQQISIVFSYLVNAGLNGNLAYLIAMRTIGYPKGCRLAGSGPLHYCFFGKDLSWSSFIKGKFLNPSKENYTEQRNIIKVDGLFGEKYDDQGEVERLYSKTFHKEAKAANPFKKGLTTTAGCGLGEYAKRMKSIESEIMEVLGCQKYL